MRKEKTIEDDAVSITVGYILNLGTATLVISLLILSLQGTVSNVRNQAAQTQLEVIGQKISSRLSEADKIARLTGANGTLELEIPRDIAGQPYEVSVTEGWVNLTSSSTNVAVKYNVSLHVVNSTFSGGGTRIIKYNSTDLVIKG